MIKKGENRMNSIKIQQEAIKAIRPAYIEIDNTRIALVTDGSFAVVIFKEDCLLDLAKLKKMERNVFYTEPTAIPLNPTMEIRDTGKGTVRKFISENNDIMWLSEKNIKRFGKNLTYKMKTDIAFVYGDNVLLGCILPVRIRESR